MKIEFNVGEKYLIRSTGEVVSLEKYLNKDSVVVSGIEGKRIVLLSVLKEIKQHKIILNY